MEKKKVLVGMSGGIDSSAVCMMLQEQGYDLIGVTMRMWDAPSKFAIYGQEQPDYVIEAKELADKLGFPHHVLDVRGEFKDVVVKDFIDEYMKGRTPNPCVMCNIFFKWKYLQALADELCCDYIATGHYAQIVDKEGIYYIEQGIDSTKDQSYFLWRLGQKELKRTLFPLGGMTKKEVRDYVFSRGFVEKSQKSESMEICFVETDYREFLKEQLPEIDQLVGQGYFVNKQGKKLGLHKGFPYYTVGQRKGLNIALGYPAFVLKINPVKNTIILGEKDDLIAHNLIIEHCNIPSYKDLESQHLMIRIRYRSQLIPCRVEKIEDDRIFICFDHDLATGITPGQSAVMYIENRVVGGGLISHKRK
ncbi:MAG: tRNA 2-thiouridine(34) synthase MnmA [Bacteroidales bacterium]